MGCVFSISANNNAVGNVENVARFSEKQLSVMFENKPQAEQEDILMYIYTNWHHIQQNSSLIEALKHTKFVTSGDGDLCKPTDLFDPGDTLLTLCFGGEAHKFPGERFVSDRWLNILRKTGLQNTHDDADTVLRCARRIEFLGAQSMKYSENQQVSLEIWSLAETLIKTVFENVGLLQDHGFCDAFGKIACVPAEINVSYKSGKRCVRRRVVCSYNDAILSRDWPLAWSAAPVLSDETLVPPEYAWGALQLRSPPPVTKVLNHLQANTWCDESSLFTWEEASCEVLKYLGKIWETLSSSDILELQQLAFIAADNGTRLATPGSLFVRLGINMSPLASELPSCYLPFVEILKELGVEDMLSISSAMNILSSFHKSCGDYRLNPNELLAVIELLQFLFDKTIDLQTSSDRPSWESELVVPDDGCRLVRPNICVYVDPRGSQYVNYIDSSKLRFVHPDVSERLCLAFGIRKLSNVVVEELDHVERLRTLEEADSVSLAAIRLKLLSRSFQVAVSSVVNTFSHITPGSRNPDFPTLKRSLESVAKRLKFVHCIYTRFRILPKYLDITHGSNKSFISDSRSGSSHRALYYVDRSYTCMLIAAKRPNYISVVDLVSIVVSHVLGSPLPLPIGSLFLCPHDSEAALVNILKLSCGKRVIEGVGRGNRFLGRDLLPTDEKKVHLVDKLKVFSKGEIVAWESRKGEKLKYGRILKDVGVKLPKEEFFYTIELETSPGRTKTVINSNVFNFKIWTTEEDSSSTLGMPVKSDNIVSSMQVPPPERCGGENLKNQRDAIKEPGSGHVPAEEFVKSVEVMLSVAGNYMDPESSASSKQLCHCTNCRMNRRRNLCSSRKSKTSQQKKLNQHCKQHCDAKSV